MTTDTMTNNASARTRKFKLTYIAIPSILVLMAAGFTYMTVSTTNITQNPLSTGYLTSLNSTSTQNNNINA